MPVQDSYIKLMSRGEVFEGIVIRVQDTPSIYKDKKLWPVIIRDPKEASASEEIIASDFLASEVSTGESKFARLIGQKIRFVVISPGDGTSQKLPWVKLDEVQSDLDNRDKMYVAQQSFRIAADLIIAGKADGLVLKNIDELAKRVADKIINLSKSL